MLLASTAAGCSSDASRFSSVFAPDTLTTASIPGRSSVVRQPPVPAEDIGGASMAARQQTLSQPYPQQQAVAPASARAASTPVAVQRAELSAPTLAASTANNAARQEALSQPFPNRPAGAAPASSQQTAAAPIVADNLTTGSNRAAQGWSAANGARITLRPGETIAMLADRYGVPEREILRANGLTHSSDAASGQLVIIPTFNGGANVARAAAEASGLPTERKPIVPDQPQQNVAVLPATPSSREKTQVANTAATGNAQTGAGAGGSGYTVKPGDSLTKIAKANGVSVDSLKQANGLSTANIRIGQVLAIPTAGTPVAAAPVSQKADPVKTASVPATPANQPAGYTPPANKSVTEVAKADPQAAAPELTGIGKYRWPANGAVIARFGANIDGKRSDGIAISVPKGTPVKAAENGVVIYAGNGLKELGNTVLIRHDDGKVTVYGHADSLNVQRGQKVQRGQTIASSGMSGNVKRPMLHFEVRKDAAPVDPMSYLE